MFFSLSYWFNLRPRHVTQEVMITLIAIFGVLVVIGVVSKFLQSKYAINDKLRARVWRKVGNLGLVMGTLGLLYTFFIYEEIYIFSARVWFVVWFMVTLFCIWRIIQLARVKIPQEKSSISERLEFEKYLPKSKNS